MATKKQKREAALAKRKRFLEKETALGLEAQRLARKERERESQIAMDEAEEINRRHRRILAAYLIAREGYK